MKVFVVFGSASDENVSLPLVEALKKDCDTEYQVISAHRDLEKLQDTLGKWEGDAVIAGAGLAAALPGVAAAMVKIPVYGVAVPAQFGGLDSFASIAQMPPGVPVITAGPSKPEAIVAFLKKYKDASADYTSVNFVMRDEKLINHPDLLAEIEKATKAGAEKGIKVTLSKAEDKKAFNVIIATEEAHVSPDGFCLHLPFMPKDAAKKPENYLNSLALAEKGGLWVGVNNTRNAVHAVARLGAASQRISKRAAA